MPIRFPCPECQQRLSVASQKAGREVRCPRCRRTVRVPAVPNPSVAHELATITEVLPTPHTDSNPDQETELVYADAPAASAAATPGETLVTIPRQYVYGQGLLLGSVALGFFIFGLIVGSRAGPDLAGVALQPCTISGEIRFQAAAQNDSADNGARVIVVPQAVRPDQKAAASGLRPSDPAPADGHVGMAVLRSLGGDVTSVDEQGRFQCHVPSPGRYYILVISRHAKRPDHATLEGRDLAQIGRYISPAANVLESQQYTWQELRVRGDCTFDHRF